MIGRDRHNMLVRIHSVKASKTSKNNCDMAVQCFARNTTRVLPAHNGGKCKAINGGFGLI